MDREINEIPFKVRANCGDPDDISIWPDKYQNVIVQVGDTMVTVGGDGSIEIATILGFGPDRLIRTKQEYVAVVGTEETFRDKKVD